MISTQNPTSPAKLAVDASQAAIMLSISERTLWALTNSGQVKHVRIGRMVRYRIGDLEEFLEKCLSTKEPA